VVRTFYLRFLLASSHFSALPFLVLLLLSTYVSGDVPWKWTTAAAPAPFNFALGFRAQIELPGWLRSLCIAAGIHGC
jgi:hypothetical protein